MLSKLSPKTKPSMSLVKNTQNYKTKLKLLNSKFKTIKL